MSRRRPQPGSLVKRRQGIAGPLPPGRALYRPAAKVVFACDGVPGNDCGRRLVTFSCDAAPETWTDVIRDAHVPLLVDERDDGQAEWTDVSFICQACGRESYVVPTENIRQLLVALVKRGGDTMRVSPRQVARTR